MEMNYSKIVIDGCSEFVKSKTSFESYFKREAKINERDNFIEFADFFNGCMEVVKKYENIIKNQYDNEISNCNFIISQYKQGKVKDSYGVIISAWTKTLIC
jgi:hypothetical protein